MWLIKVMRHRDKMVEDILDRCCIRDVLNDERMLAERHQSLMCVSNISSQRNIAASCVRRATNSPSCLIYTAVRNTYSTTHITYYLGGC